MTKPVELDDRNIGRNVQGHSLVMIDFWAADCQPCKVTALIVKELAEKYEGRIFVGAVRVDKNPETVERFSIRGVPTLLIMNDGCEIDRIVLQINDIVQLMKEYVNEKLKHLESVHCDFPQFDTALLFSDLRDKI